MKPKPTAFVLLAHGFDADAWHRNFHEGKIIGLNEEYPYGYHHAEKSGISVKYSRSSPEGVIGKSLRLSLRVILGFDLIHAWRNRQAFFDADFIWTHTESQGLAAGLLCLLHPKKPAPRMILQSVWLCDRWQSLGSLKRIIYQKLLSQADILTFHSPLNLSKARDIFPEKRCELVRFGIAAHKKNSPRAPRNEAPVKLLAVGNDRHRDWETLINAVRGCDDMLLTIVSSTVPMRLVNSAANCRVVQPRHNSELDELFDTADIVIVPLQPNLHASGITVVEEAAVKGCTTIVTDTGGLRSYFGDEDVWYVPPQNHGALREAIIKAAQDTDTSLAKVVSAQNKMGPEGLSSVSFVRQHVSLSLELNRC